MNNARAARCLLQAGADKDAQDSREQTPLFLAAREGAMEVAQMLLEVGAARGLRDQAGLAPSDVARQRNHWDLLTLLEGEGERAEPPEARHTATPGRETGTRAHARTASGGGARPRCRTLSAGASPRGGGACLPARTWSVDLGARGGAAYARCRSRSGGAGGPPSRGRRLSGSRGPMVRGRPGVAAACGASTREHGWPRDWVTLGAAGPASSAPAPSPCLTPSPERGSPQVVWGLPVYPGGGNPK